MPAPSPLYIICGHRCYSCFVLHQLGSVEFACLPACLQSVGVGGGEKWKSSDHWIQGCNLVEVIRVVFFTYSGKIFDID